MTRSWVLAVFLTQAPPAYEPSRVAGLVHAGDYERAETAARAAVALARGAAGADARLATARALGVLADVLVRNGRIAGHESEHAAREALALKTAVLGSEHPETARTLAVLGAALLARGDPHESARVLERALPILRVAGAEVGAALVEALATGAEARLGLDDPQGALAACDEALRLARALEPADPMLVARLLDVQTFALHVHGEWERGAATAREAMALRDEAAPGHPETAVTQRLIGDQAWRAGRLTEAGEHYRRAVEIADATLRPAHPLRTRALGRLASWEADAGLLEQALPRHQEALDGALESLGPEHPRIAYYLNDLGNALVFSGDAPAAVGRFEQAVRLTERVHGPSSPALATPLFNLSWALAQSGEWDLAAPPLGRALDLWRKAYGDHDARVLLAYKDWADVLAGAGRDAEAVEFYERVVQGRVAAGEGGHPATASARAGLAAALARLGRLREAERVAALAEPLLGRAGWRDREYAEVLALRAELALRQGGQAARRALWQAVESDGIMRGHVRNTVRFLGERQALSYIDQRFRGRDVALTVVADRPADGRAARAVLDAVARSRALVLDEIAARAQQRASTPAAAAAWSRLVAAHESLARLLYSASFQRDADGDVSLARAQAEVHEAEQAAALAGAGGPRGPESDENLVDRLAARLPAHTALVSFHAYTRARGPRLRAYVAFVLRAGARRPTVIPLGAAQPIDDLVARWHAALDVRDKQGVARVNAALDLSRRLAERLWEPLRATLRGARRVVLVPDGSLHLVSFAALLDDSRRFLVESGPTLHIVSAERDLLSPPRPASRPGVLIVAAPAFDDGRALARDKPVAAGATAWASAEPDAAEEQALWRGEKAACARLGDMEFTPLPASAAEADDLRALWTRREGDTATLLTGAAAGEAAFRAAASAHSVLHVATHGFVVDDACAARRRSAAAPRVSPLLLSGVALAGANRRRRAAADDDDGILTAAEIAGLDLRRADWVVLSGCETGRGEIRASEGVLGLRRAFAEAGAGTVIMSLWRVLDDDARAWMAGLYRARLVHGLDTAESVRAAARAALERLRQAGSRPDPARWAAFVAAGDWR